MKIPVSPPNLSTVFSDPETLQKVIRAGVKPTISDKYRHWDTVRQLVPPEGLTSEEWWAGIKLARMFLHKQLPFRDAKGEPFRFAMPDPAWEMVHLIDQKASGEIAFAELVTNPQSRRRYLVSSLIEEAITSSQLEGATTTGRVAKEMIKSGRRPRTQSERMILNNYEAMNRISRLESTAVSKDLILELHRILTTGTLEDESDAGRIQQPGDARVVVKDRQTHKILHVPPPAEQLEDRLDALVDFANGGGFEGGFLHPVVRAILVHFWLAYDHPFADGNGRTARALFYWTMLRQGYWLTEFLSISRILRTAPGQYGGAFLYTETDDGDTTYFILHQLKVICRAIDDLHTYLGRKMRDVRQAEQLLKGLRLSRRQLALLGHALRNQDGEYTFKSHMRSHDVVYETARSDLLELLKLGFLTQDVVGREYVFRPADDLADRLRAAGSAPVPAVDAGIQA
jgi:Fic family protein